MLQISSYLSKRKIRICTKNKKSYKYFLIYLNYKAQYVFKIKKIINTFKSIKNIRFNLYLILKSCRFFLIYLKLKAKYIFKNKKL